MGRDQAAESAVGVDHGDTRLPVLDHPPCSGFLVTSVDDLGVGVHNGFEKLLGLGGEQVLGRQHPPQKLALEDRNIFCAFEGSTGDSGSPSQSSVRSGFGFYTPTLGLKGPALQTPVPSLLGPAILP